MKRCLGLIALCLVVSACGSSAPGVHGSDRVHLIPPSPTAYRFSAASNRAVARRDIEKLLRAVNLPASARQVPAVPKSAPSWFRNELSHDIPGAEVAHRTWIVPAPLKQVVRYYRTHVPPRPRPELGSPDRINRIGTRPHDSYVFRPVPGRSSTRWLNVSMLALAGGRTVVTAQAGDTWIHPPAHAVLPGTIRQIDITSRYRGEGRTRVRLHIGDRYLVGSIVSWINGLGVGRHVLCFGMTMGGPTVTLTFRDARGTAIARGSIFDAGGSGRSSVCNPLTLTVNGHAAPALTADDLLLRIQQYTGANLAPPLPRDVARCLRDNGWRVRPVPGGLSARRKGPATRITFRANGTVTTAGPRRSVISRCLVPVITHWG